MKNLSMSLSKHAIPAVLIAACLLFGCNKANKPSSAEAEPTNAAPSAPSAPAAGAEAPAAGAEAPAPAEAPADAPQEKQEKPDPLAHASSDLPPLVQSECADPSFADGEKAQWTCGTDHLYRCEPQEFKRCEPKIVGKGCDFKRHHYSSGTHIENGNAMCGRFMASADAKDYTCDTGKSAELCTAKTCKCGTNTIKQGQFCQNHSVVADAEYPDCHDDLTIDGKIYCGTRPISEDSEFECRNGRLYCDRLECKLGEVRAIMHTWLDDDNRVLCGNDPLPANPQGFQCNESHQWTCGDDEENTNITCTCGDAKIPSGMQCMGDTPSCYGRPVNTVIPGFGCINDLYECAQSWGCDLGNGTVCKFTQVLKDGKCVSTQQKPMTGDYLCLEGNCPCGNGFCGVWTWCKNNECVCGAAKEDKDCMDESAAAAIDDDTDNDFEPCHYDLENEVKSQKHGEFICDEFDESGSVEDVTNNYFYCENPKGCHIGDIHYAQGTEDLLAYGYPQWDKRNYEHYDKGCPYHIDGDVDTTEESLCISGDCVVPRKDGHCAVESMGDDAMHWVELSEPGRRHGKQKIYNATKCPGGTRYCHGKKNAPITLPEKGDGYWCTALSETLKAWTCEKEGGCICGGSTCAEHHVCADEKCLSPQDFIKQSESKAQ